MQLKEQDAFFTKLVWDEVARHGVIGAIGRAGERGCLLLAEIRRLKDEARDSKSNERRM
jgi:hypothetical protein